MDYSDKRGRELIRLIKQGKAGRVFYGDKRLYLDFSCEVNRESGEPNVSAYSAGCIFDCYFCAAPTRRFLGPNPMKFIPPNAYKEIEQIIGYYSPSGAVEKMIEVGEKKSVSALGSYRIKGFDSGREITKFMLMGCEPTMGISHIFGILEEIKNSKYSLVLETNGLLLGKKPEYIRKLKQYRNNCYVVLSIKSGSEEDFQRMTNRPGRLLRYQYDCLASLVKADIPVFVAYMCGPGFGNEQEEENILRRMADAGFTDRNKMTKTDYIPFFVSEYIKNKKWNKGAILS